MWTAFFIQYYSKPLYIECKNVGIMIYVDSGLGPPCGQTWTFWETPSPLAVHITMFRVINLDTRISGCIPHEFRVLYIPEFQFPLVNQKLTC